jgi:protoporphyrinogen oxidase
MSALVIGGGVTGLAAAYELERLGLDYTLIEVKGRLGGSVTSERRGPWVLDGGPFILKQTRPWPLLDALGLGSALDEVAVLPDGARLVTFKDGTQSLVDALVARLTRGRVLTRMSASSIGMIGSRFAVCLENGMVYDADALIVAAPARYAERMFYGFITEITLRLLRFRSDTITRVTLGLRAGDAPLPLACPPDLACAFARWTASPHRVPPGHVLAQVGVRFPLPQTSADALAAEVCRALNISGAPLVTRADYWPEAHALGPYDPAHNTLVDEIEALLPPGLALAGSDYRARLFEDRLTQGAAAARRAVGG